MSHVVRRWVWMEDILDWYEDFNRIRRGFFTEHGVYDRMLPASTLVGDRNAAGAAIIADVLAIQPLDAPVSTSTVRSPLQCPAEDYGSSFSRAVEVNFPDCRYLYVSGTASIDADGATLHVGDTAAQIDRTFEVVGALLASRGMTWRDVTRGIAYFRNAVDAPLYHQYCREHGLTDLPVIVAESTICRDDLLFEIQVDGITRQPDVAHFLS
ncbi:MAG: hypothetical protein IID55_03150 [Proteobacteria bacterium]|nr:hypothetical protein [Pseudomonadota bacterium]